MSLDQSAFQQRVLVCSSKRETRAAEMCLTGIAPPGGNSLNGPGIHRCKYLVLDKWRDGLVHVIISAGAADWAQRQELLRIEHDSSRTLPPAARFAARIGSIKTGKD